MNKKIVLLFTTLFILLLSSGCKKKEDKSYKREDDFIYFGTYPQTLVSDEKIIDKLNNKSGDLPTKENSHNWTSYNYYINSNVENYMFYQDIDLDNDKTYDYRGVYFIEYRPDNVSDSSSITTSFQDDNGYYVNNVYWFKYEPIKWQIRCEENGLALIFSCSILDSQDFYPSDKGDIFDHNNGEGYINNYALSNIRKWLNEDFYNLSFTNLEKEIIVDREVDNGAASTDGNAKKYTCENTVDHIFLLSLTDMLNDSNMDNRLSKGTPYALSQGLYTESTIYGYWRLRSPDSCGPAYIWTAMSDGIIRGGTVFDTGFGVRPALWIKL